MVKHLIERLVVGFLHITEPRRIRRQLTNSTKINRAAEILEALDRYDDWLFRHDGCTAEVCSLAEHIDEACPADN